MEFVENADYKLEALQTEIKRYLLADVGNIAVAYVTNRFLEFEAALLRRSLHGPNYWTLTQNLLDATTDPLVSEYVKDAESIAGEFPNDREASIVNAIGPAANFRRALCHRLRCFPYKGRELQKCLCGDPIIPEPLQ